MYKTIVFVYLLFTLITVSLTAPRGGRGGGGGRSSGRSSGGRRGSSSSSISSKSFGGSHTGSHPSGGWVNGFFHTPHHYTYIPSHTSRISPYRERTEEESRHNEDNDKYAVGYAISRSLNGNFFSIFNMVNDIAKIPDKIKNKEFTTTTSTEGPVSTYNINHIIEPTYTSPNSILELNPKSDNTDQDMAIAQNSSDGIENILKMQLDKLTPNSYNPDQEMADFQKSLSEIGNLFKTPLEELNPKSYNNDHDVAHSQNGSDGIANNLKMQLEELNSKPYNPDRDMADFQKNLSEIENLFKLGSNFKDLSY